MESLLEGLSQIQPAEWLQVIAAGGACLTAFFSWKAVMHAEEISFKPVITLEVFYKPEGQFLICKIANISKEGDRWARDIHVRIFGFGPDRKEGGGYVGPGESCTLVFKNLRQKAWTGKTLIVSYTNFNMKKYELRYRLPHEAPKITDVHTEDTALQLERIA